jgi:hypothetical protein
MADDGVEGRAARRKPGATFARKYDRHRTGAIERP